MSSAAANSHLALEKGMPAALQAEAFIIGSLMLDGERLSEVAGSMKPEDLAAEPHRRIYHAILALGERGITIDRVTVANEMLRTNTLESVGGLSFLVSLDDGIPRVSSLSSYVQIVRDKSALRRIAVTAQQIMNRALMAEDSPDDILAGAEESLLGIGDSRQSGDDAGLMGAGEFLGSFPGGFNAFASPSTRATGLQTGFIRYDEMTGGLRAGEMTILAARPSMGKSAIALNMAWSIATRHQVPVALFSLEMSRESLLLRMLCSAARIDSQRLRAGYLNEEERNRIRRARQELTEAPIFIDDASNVGLMDIRAKLRRFQQVHLRKPGLVVVDYLQLMARPGRGDNENADLTKLSRGLKLLAGEVGCPFLVLSQFSRASEQRTGDKKPQLSDLRGSGALEQDADVVAFVHRSEVYHRDREDLRGLADLIIGKQRNGPVGEVPLVFLHAMVKFENRAEQETRLPYAE